MSRAPPVIRAAVVFPEPFAGHRGGPTDFITVTGMLKERVRMALISPHCTLANGSNRNIPTLLSSGHPDADIKLKETECPYSDARA